MAKRGPLSSGLKFARWSDGKPGELSKSSSAWRGAYVGVLGLMVVESAGAGTAAGTEAKAQDKK